MDTQQGKTIIGKNNVLFLGNDSSKELYVHCNGLDVIKDKNLSRYHFKKFMIFIYPNKSLIYKDDLPPPYVFKYRPSLQIYQNKFKKNAYDLYEVLKNEEDVYYKTDTHINYKGNYIVYKYFVETMNKRFNLNIIPKDINFEVIKTELTTLPYGVGDLLSETNLRNQKIQDKTDTFYYNEEMFFYCNYKIKNDSNIRFLTYELEDMTENLESENSIVYWDIIREYIIYVKNENKVRLKVLIFYDSYFLSNLPLFFDIFNEIYFVKSVYNNTLINLINPSIVFEFRSERFLM